MKLYLTIDIYKINFQFQQAQQDIAASNHDEVDDDDEVEWRTIMCNL